MGYKRIARIDETNPPQAGGTLLSAVPAAELDLHRLTVAQAERKIRAFLQSAAARHRGRVVRIITGKGQHSDGPPKLGAALETQLARLPTLVAESRPAPDGGSWLVRLR